MRSLIFAGFSFVLTLALTHGIQSPKAFAKSNQTAESSCYKHIKKALTLCWPQNMDNKEKANPNDHSNCDRHFEEALMANRSLFMKTPGLIDRLLQGGAFPTADELNRYVMKDSAHMTCAASAMIWRSILRPTHLRYASSVPVALRILERTDILDAQVLDGLAHWTRGVLRAQAPAIYGGQLPRAQMDFENAGEHDGDMKGFIAALEARFLCTALQNAECFEEAKSRALETTTSIDAEITIKRLIRWVENRRYLYFLQIPLSEP